MNVKIRLRKFSRLKKENKEKRDTAPHHLCKVVKVVDCTTLIVDIERPRDHNKKHNGNRTAPRITIKLEGVQALDHNSLPLFFQQDVLRLKDHAREVLSFVTMGKSLPIELHGGEDEGECIVATLFFDLKKTSTVSSFLISQGLVAASFDGKISSTDVN
jgi:endonuclease YncB( thermonuclease family)